MKEVCGKCSCLEDIDKSQQGGYCCLTGSFMKFTNLCDCEYEKCLWDAGTNSQNEGCEFCEKYDFARAKIEIDKYGVRIVLAGGLTRFTKKEQFNYCPMCGRKLTEEE